MSGVPLAEMFKRLAAAIAANTAARRLPYLLCWLRIILAPLVRLATRAAEVHVDARIAAACQAIGIIERRKRQAGDGKQRVSTV